MFVSPKRTDEGELKLFLPRMTASSENFIGSSTDSEEAWTGTFIPYDVCCTYDMQQTRASACKGRTRDSSAPRYTRPLVAEKRTDT